MVSKKFELLNTMNVGKFGVMLDFCNNIGLCEMCPVVCAYLMQVWIELRDKFLGMNRVVCRNSSKPQFDFGTIVHYSTILSLTGTMPRV